MARQRRERRTGSLYRRGRDGRWFAAVKVEGRQRTVSSALFCRTLQRMGELQAGTVQGRGVDKRAERMLTARALGTHTAAEWNAYVKDHAGRCEYCGCICKPTKDHRTPVSRGGSDALENLAVACLWCNHRKNDMTEAEWRAKVRPVMHTCRSVKPRRRPSITAKRRAEVQLRLRRMKYGW